MASNKFSTILKVCVLAVMLVIGTQSCRISYKFNGAALDYSVYKTISISDFPIRAALVYPPLQQTFENELRDYVERNTRLRMTDGNADLQIEGEINGYSLDQTFSAYRDFDSSEMLTDVQDELCQQISEELVELIFNATLGNW
jgi:hypothetical protein